MRHTRLIAKVVSQLDACMLCIDDQYTSTNDACLDELSEIIA